MRQIKFWQKICFIGKSDRRLVMIILENKRIRLMNEFQLKLQQLIRNIKCLLDQNALRYTLGQMEKKGCRR